MHPVPAAMAQDLARAHAADVRRAASGRASTRRDHKVDNGPVRAHRHAARRAAGVFLVNVGLRLALSPSA